MHEHHFNLQGLKLLVWKIVKKPLVLLHLLSFYYARFLVLLNSIQHAILAKLKHGCRNESRGYVTVN